MQLSIKSKNTMACASYWLPTLDFEYKVHKLKCLYLRKFPEEILVHLSI